MSNTTDIVDKIISYESGDMNEDETINFFQELYSSGVWHSLQGHYRRVMHCLIEEGLINTSNTN